MKAAKNKVTNNLFVLQRDEHVYECKIFELMNFHPQFDFYTMEAILALRCIFKKSTDFSFYDGSEYLMSVKTAIRNPSALKKDKIVADILLNRLELAALLPEVKITTEWMLNFLKILNLFSFVEPGTNSLNKYNKEVFLRLV